ncbi:MAG TPA: D-alanyl-D-alanine carboxypeptidase/D-alanyl-D-alanine-endopeptidase [Kofleriaceae bacterium]|nr:D-alanyl-D-alanine carboxypeptidase/D-alanyl-D-alanine-endopeptidase [Kofleriaceae bacterium]
MVTSRVLAVIVTVASIGVQPARSQPAAGSDTPPAAPQLDDEEAAASGSGANLVAPADPKARLVWLQTKLGAAISSHPQLGKARLGIYAIDLATGQDLFTHDADAGLEIASNTKLLTSIAALGTLGGGFRWRTAVYADDIDDATGKVKGNLYLRGRGDPTLSVGDLKQLAADVAARGIRSIDGDLVVDATYFDADTEPPHFGEQPKEQAGFRAPVASLGVGKSAFTVTVMPEPGANGFALLDPDVPDYIKLGKVEVKTVTDKRTRVKIDVKPKGGKLEVEVTGQIKVATGSYDVRKRVDDPIKLATSVFREALAAREIKLAKRGFSLGAIPPAAKLVAAHDSAPLSLVIRDMNKQSDNYVAESVLKTLGAETRATPGPATWVDGKAAVAAFVGKLGMPPGSYRADNGSGLYSASEVSARQLVVLLRAAYRDFRIGPDLVASLPVGGVDGTLAHRWSKSAAKGRVRAKTGTLDKVVSIAGYLGVEGAHQLAFAIVANEIPQGQRAAARALADDMVDALLAYVDAAQR